jgi:hypothetical protein
MALCPVCSTPGAYIGFNSVECRNPKCEHFSITLEEVCPCCGQAGHTAAQHSTKARSGIDALDASQSGSQTDAEDPQKEADPS